MAYGAATDSDVLTGMHFNFVIVMVAYVILGKGRDLDAGSSSRV